MTNTSHDRHLSQEELELFLPRIREEEPGADLRSHLEGCRRCRRELRDLRSLDEALAGLPEMQPSARFADAVMARVRLPAPWYQKLWSTVVERWLLAALIVTGGGATGGFTLWIASRPDISLGGLASFVVERLTALFWAVVVAAGRLTWESGLPGTVRELATSVELFEAAAAMALLSGLTAGVAFLMKQLMTAQPRAHARG